MSKPIFYQLLVIDNQDPLMLGRIRATLLIDNYQDVIKSFDAPPWNEQTDPWSDRDPFIFNPLLPYFVYQVPKINELVQAMYVDSDFKYQNQYYVQNAFYSPTSSFFTFQEGANKFTGTGMQIKPPKPLRNKTDGSYTEKGIHYGVFPEPGDNAILGRGSADLVVKENEVLLRAGKFQANQLQPNVLPTANQQRGFLQLSRFSYYKIPQDPKTYFTINDVVLSVKYLIEWVITNPENTEDNFTGSVYLYQLKADFFTNTQNLTVDSVIDENLKKLVASQNFSMLTMSETVNYINNFIKTCNDLNYTASGTQLFSPQVTNKFPIYYRPGSITYSIIQPSSGSAIGPEFNNVSEIFKQIKLYSALKQGGYGLIYKKNTVGTPTESKEVVVPQTKYIADSSTVAALGSDRVYLLSHLSSIPGKKKINFDNTLYGIPSEVFDTNIEPNTSSMVRGEELLELINLIVRFLTTHTHAYPGLPPVPITQDGTTTTQLLTEMQNAVYKILNDNIRIN
jgi:hypothetical protein